MPDSSPRDSVAAPSTRLVPVLVVSFLSSIGTGMVTNGAAFLGDQGYQFSRAANYLLALVLGATYIVGASQAGRAMRLLSRLGLSTRAILAGQLAVMAALTSLPIIQGRPAGDSGPSSAWSLWILVALYSPLSGMLWPTIESYVSGGRDPRDLRRALGHFNWVWSLATMLSLIAMGPIVVAWPQVLLAGLGVVHLLTIPCLAWFEREPGAHDGHHVQDPNSVALLRAFRVLLPISYGVSTAMVPFLPSALASLGIAPAFRAPVAATWHAARVVVFVTLGRWHAWHGRWWPAWTASIMLLAGFALVVLSPLVPGAGIAMIVAGLGVFGVGMATIYTSALYYAQEVGAAKVDAGGAHESFIGIGYMVGPTAGLIVGQTVPAADFEVSVVVVVGTMAAGLIIPFLASLHRFRTRAEPRASNP